MRLLTIVYGMYFMRYSPFFLKHALNSWEEPGMMLAHLTGQSTLTTRHSYIRMCPVDSNVVSHGVVSVVSGHTHWVHVDQCGTIACV